MRPLAIICTAALLLAACATPDVAPKGPPVVVADATLPRAEDLRVEPDLAVRTRRPTRLYTGRGAFFLLVAELPADTPVKYLASREGWLQVGLPSGETGWLSMADAVVTDPQGGLQYQFQTGRWAVQIGDMKIEAQRVAPGVLRLGITGLPKDAKLTETTGGDLALVGTLPPAVRAALPIGDSGVATISATPKGLLIDLESRLLHRVLMQGEGSLELELRPGLEGVKKSASGWLISLWGQVSPVLRSEGGQILLDLPGAVGAPGLSAMPPGLVLEQVAPEAAPADALASPTATVPSRMPAGGLRIRLREAGPHYVLDRLDPEHVELRFLASGLKGKRIAIDPGHGGEETGAEGASGVLEKAVNLQVSLLLKELLEREGAQVVMTRSTDDRVLAKAEVGKYASVSERTQADLAARSALINGAGADLLLSIHSNGGPPADGGIETYWAVPNLNATLSRRLAGLVQEELVGALGLADRGVKQRPFNVIRYSEAPAVLVEMGFLTNGVEEQVLTSSQGQGRVAAALVRAVQRYFE